jgi:hypothetical protein
LWLLLLGAVLSLQLWFPNLDSEQHDTYSVEVAGRKALYELADAQRVSGRLPPVRRNLDSFSRALQRIPETGTYCLLGPSRYPTSGEWKTLLNWVQQGGVLLVAARWDNPELSVEELGVKIRIPKAKDPPAKSGTTPTKAATTPSPEKSESKPANAVPDDAEKKEPNAAEKSSQKEQATSSPGNKSSSGKKSVAAKKAQEKQLNVLGTFHNTLHPDGKLDWNSAAEISAPGGEVLARVDDQPQIVQMQHGEGTILFVASDYIFSNDALFAPGKDNAFLAYRILETVSANREVLIFDEFLNTTGTPKVVGLLLNNALRPLTLQLLALLVLLALTGTRRFGGLLPRSAPARHDITEHVNALGLLYYRVNNSRALLGALLDQVRHELRLRGDKFPDPQTWAALAQRLRQDPAVMKQLLTDVGAAVQDPKLTRRRGSALLRELSELRHAMRKK